LYIVYRTVYCIQKASRRAEGIKVNQVYILYTELYIVYKKHRAVAEDYQLGTFVYCMQMCGCDPICFLDGVHR
jgi:hypothetical protein